MREFKTAARQAVDPEAAEKPIEFEVDGEVWRAYKPTEGQLAWLMANATDFAKVEDQAAASINFFVGLFDDDTRRLIAQRLLDRDDPFGLEEIGEITEYLTEEWAARPTKPSSVSTPSRRSTGRKSTATAPFGESTPLPSARTGS
jgi:hypothetical protein